MLRDYQIAIAEQAKDILLHRLIVYLSIEMRVGKTLIALHTAELYGAENVLFITKKKAISSIMSDYDREGFPFKLTVINYEQLHNYEPVYDFYIVDEAHGNGAFPKPSLRTKQLRRLVGHMPLMLLSGTASPESYSQLFHQVWISLNSPFKHANFYKWAHEFVNIKQKKINGMLLNDYNNAKRDEIMNVLSPYFISFTQSEAGFQQSDVIEEIKEIDIDPRINKLVAYLLKNKYFKFKDGSELVCDSAVKLQNKVHQLFSGTVKLEDGTVKILDTSKVEYIKTAYQGMKIAIFYKFIAEGKALREALDNWTDDPDEFNNSKDKIFISQIQSGSMGVNLATADVLIFYNIDFSSTQYWQARARLQTLNRKNAPISSLAVCKGRHRAKDNEGSAKQEGLHQLLLQTRLHEKLRRKVMQEKQIQKKIIEYLKSIGAYVLKTVVTSRSGVPDIIACYCGVFLAFEVKKEDGVVSKLQEYNIQEIKKAGGTCAVVRSLDEVKRIIAIQ